MKSIKQYVLLVDGWRGQVQCENKFENLYRRNTAGRYRVAAKTEKEAIALLREKIGFGSIQVYYEDKNPNPRKVLKYKEVKKEDLCNNEFEEPRHATSSTKKDNKEIVYEY